MAGVKKEEKKKKAAKTTVVQERADTTRAGTDPAASQNNAGQAKKFDNFVDKNNNGIDDRRENLKAKASSKGTKKEEKKD